MGLDSANTKVQEICNLLKKETLDPAKMEAKRIVEEAEQKAHSALEKGKERLKALEEEHQKKLEKQLEVHEMAIQLAIKQGVAQLKENVLSIFSEDLKNQLGKQLENKDSIKKIVETLIASLEKEGVNGDFSVLVPKGINSDELLNDLSSSVKNRLKNNKVEIGPAHSGIYVVIDQDNIGIEVSKDSMMILLAEYVSSDLRKRIVKA